MNKLINNIVEILDTDLYKLTYSSIKLSDILLLFNLIIISFKFTYLLSIFISLNLCIYYWKLRKENSFYILYFILCLLCLFFSLINLNFLILALLVNLRFY